MRLVSPCRCPKVDVQTVAATGNANIVDPTSPTREQCAVSLPRLAKSTIDRLIAPLSPQAALRRGLCLQRIERPVDAFQLLARAAKAGLTEGQYQVGRCYLTGIGVPRSVHAAMKWLERAGHRGHLQAQEVLAVLRIHYTIDSPPVTDRVFADWPPSAQSGDPRATPDAALKWAYLAAERGSAIGSAVLGYIFAEGPLHLRDPHAALEWYERAAYGGNAQGALGYALLLARTACTSTERRTVVGWLRQAADAGLPTAFYMLGMMTGRGEGVDRDPCRATDLFRQGAERGSLPCQTLWGQALLEGHGGPADPVAGETWLRRAALAGDPHAAALVGNIYAREGELPPNFFEASIWFRRASELGHLGAARALGMLYLTGRGVPRDKQAALYWLRLAERAAGPASGRLYASHSLSSVQAHPSPERTGGSTAASDQPNLATK